MNTYPLWKSLYFESTANSVEYRIMLGGVNEIFRGQAHKSPETGKIRIKVNDICASYLDSLLEEEDVRRSLGVDTLIPTNAYTEFTLETYNPVLPGWGIAMEWAFVNDTSWLQRYTGEGTYSEPINGHAAADQLIPYSYLVTVSQTYTICYNGTSPYFIITRGQTEELSDSGGTWEIDYETNIENTYYEMRSLSAARLPITGYTSGGTISFELSANTDAFQEEYEVTFYDEPNGTRLSSAVAYIGAGEPGSGFTHFIRIHTAPSYIYSAGTQATFEYRTNCDGRVKYELSSSYTEGSGYEIYQTGITNSLTSLTVQIPANPDYQIKYYKMEIYGSDALAPDSWIVSDYTLFTQQDRQHYFYFITPSGEGLPFSATTNTITWDTDYDEIKYELTRDGVTTETGITSDSGRTFTFPQNDTNNTITYALNAFTTGGTPLGTIRFYHFDETSEYLNTYLTLDIISGGTITWDGGMFYYDDEGLQFASYQVDYSTDSGETWTTLTSAYARESGDTHEHYKESGDTINVLSGQQVQFKGINLKGTNEIKSFLTENASAKIGGTAIFNAYGNVLSIIYGDDFINHTEFPSLPNGDRAAIPELFSRANIVSAQNLILPAEELGDYAYYELFYRCSRLTAMPKIGLGGDIKIRSHSLDQTFAGCTSLTEGRPFEISEIDGGLAAYRLFSGCTAMTDSKIIISGSEKESGDMTFHQMYADCYSLTVAPDLPEWNPATQDYSECFKNCRSLTAAPEMKWQRIEHMACYGMYSGCTSLNYIKCLATYIGSTGQDSATLFWAAGVSPTGTFVKSSSMYEWMFGPSGIPSGWTIENA